MRPSLTDHLSHKVTIGNDPRIEYHSISRNTEEPTAGSVLASQTHSHQTLSWRQSTRYGGVERKEHSEQKRGDGDALIQSIPQNGSLGTNNQSEKDCCLVQSECIPVRIHSRPNQQTPEVSAETKVTHNVT